MKKFAIQYTVNGTPVGRCFTVPLAMKYPRNSTAIERLNTLLDTIVGLHNNSQGTNIQKQDIVFTACIPLD